MILMRCCSLEEATVKFKEISNAYETLSDPEAREWLVRTHSEAHTQRGTHTARHTQQMTDNVTQRATYREQHTATG